MKNIHVLPTDKPSRLRYFNGKLELMYLVPKKSDIVFQNIYITSDEEIKEGDWCIVTPFGADKFAKVIRFKKENGTLYNLDCNKITLTTDQDLIKDGVRAIEDEFLEWFVKNPSCEVVEVELKPMFPMYKTFKEDINTPPFYGNLKYKIIIPKEEPKREFVNNTSKWNMEDFEEPKQETIEEFCSFCNGTGQVVSSTTISRFKTCDCKIIPKEEPCTCTDECLGYLTKTCKRIKEEPKQETLEEVAERLYPYEVGYGVFDRNCEIDIERQRFIEGVEYQKEQEKNKYSEEDMLNFADFKSSNIMKHSDEKGFYLGTKKVFNIWFEQIKKK